MSYYLEDGAHRITHHPEHFRIKSAKPPPFTTVAPGRGFLEQARFNSFRLGSRRDPPADSGSGTQWAAIMTGAETFAGSESFLRLE